MGHPAVSYTEQLGRRYRVRTDGHTDLVVRSTMNADNGYTYADRLLPVNTSELDIFRLCALLGVEMSPEQAAAERAYIEKNRQLYEQKRHKTMEKKKFGLDANGYPVYAGETMYRKSNADKYTVQEDGSLKKGNGKTVTSPDWSNFVHTYDKTDKAEQLTAARAKRFAPKQDNPLVEGEFKTRTPEEASKAAAKQREQARKKESEEPAPAPTLDKATDKELLGEVNSRPGLPCQFWDYILDTSSDERLLAEIDRRGLNKTAAAPAPTLDAATDAEIIEEAQHRDGLWKRIQAFALDTTSALGLIEELHRRGYALDATKTTEAKKVKPSEKLLQAYTDGELADEIRRRGYTVKATKLVEL